MEAIEQAFADDKPRKDKSSASSPSKTARQINRRKGNRKWLQNQP